MSVTLTDTEGMFEFPKDKDMRWLPYVCYAANSIIYRIDAQGYLPFSTNLHGGGDFYHGSIPHALGQVKLERNPE